MSIKTARESIKMTQEEFGAKLGVKRSTVAMWETQKSFPRAELLPKIAAVLGCTVDELLGITKTPPGKGEQKGDHRW